MRSYYFSSGQSVSVSFMSYVLFYVISLVISRNLLQQSPSAVILEPQKIKSVTVSIVSPSICHEVMGPVAMILVFSMLSFKPVFFHSLLSLSSTGSLVSLCFLP